MGGPRRKRERERNQKQTMINLVYSRIVYYWIKKSFSLINRMPEIIEINKQLSYREKQNGKEMGVVYSSVLFFSW
jgi:hypothetical protein